MAEHGNDRIDAAGEQGRGDAPDHGFAADLQQKLAAAAHSGRLTGSQQNGRDARRAACCPAWTPWRCQWSMASASAAPPVLRALRTGLAEHLTRTAPPLDSGSRAAAANPTNHGAVATNQGLGAGLGGRSGDGAHHGGGGERLLDADQPRHGLDDLFVRIAHSPARYGQALPGSRDCGRARTDRGTARPPPCPARPAHSPASRASGSARPRGALALPQRRELAANCSGGPVS